MGGRQLGGRHRKNLRDWRRLISCDVGSSHGGGKLCGGAGIRCGHWRGLQLRDSVRVRSISDTAETVTVTVTDVLCARAD